MIGHTRAPFRVPGERDEGIGEEGGPVRRYEHRVLPVGDELVGQTIALQSAGGVAWRGEPLIVHSVLAAVAILAGIALVIVQRQRVL